MNELLHCENPMEKSTRRSPENEAHAFLVLLRKGYSAEKLRQDIGSGTPFRIRVLLAFDGMVARLSKDRQKLRKRVDTTAVSPLLRAEALRLLRAGLSHAAVRERVPGVGPGIILEIAKEYRISLLKRGRGRRLSPEIQNAIMQRVRDRARSSDLQREFGIDYDTTIKFRRMAGDFENRRHWKKLSPADIRKAEHMLAQGGPGGRWRDVAATLNVSLATLQKRCSYRKRRVNCHEKGLKRVARPTTMYAP